MNLTTVIVTPGVCIEEQTSMIKVAMILYCNLKHNFKRIYSSAIRIRTIVNSLLSDIKVSKQSAVLWAKLSSPIYNRAVRVYQQYISIGQKIGYVIQRDHIYIYVTVYSQKCVPPIMT